MNKDDWLLEITDEQIARHAENETKARRLASLEKVIVSRLYEGAVDIGGALAALNAERMKYEEMQRNFHWLFLKMFIGAAIVHAFLLLLQEANQ